MMRLTTLGLSAAATAAMIPMVFPNGLPGLTDFSPTPQAIQDFRWSGRLDGGQTIEIKGVNGRIHASAATGNEVVVTAQKDGSDRDQVTIEVVEHSGGVTICAVYPSKDDDEPNVCAPGRSGHMNTHNTKAEVDFDVMVPSSIRFVGKTVNGDVHARSLTSDVRASTVNGDVDISTAGFAEASTVNGSLDVSMARADWKGTTKFSTVNGSIELTIPESFSAEVEASMVNGDFSSDFPLTIQGRFGPRKVSGTIGQGGRALELTTVNGSIRLRKR